MFGNAPSMQVRFAIAWEVPEVNPPLSAPDALGLTSEDVHHLAVGVPAGARIEYCDGSVGKGASATAVVLELVLSMDQGDVDTLATVGAFVLTAIEVLRRRGKKRPTLNRPAMGPWLQFEVG